MTVANQFIWLKGPLRPKINRKMMKRFVLIVFMIIAAKLLFAQSDITDTMLLTKVTVNKDPRLDKLAQIQVDIVKANMKIASRFTKGFRLFVLKSDDRDYAMRVRAYLLQNFPEEKVIMSYQAPFIKMKFGDFVEKADAEKVRKQIIKGGVVTGGIYIVPDTIELKPDKDGKADSK
jgi:hypothetical protein